MGNLQSFLSTETGTSAWNYSFMARRLGFILCINHYFIKSERSNMRNRVLAICFSSSLKSILLHSWWLGQCPWEDVKFQIPSGRGVSRAPGVPHPSPNHLITHYSQQPCAGLYYLSLILQRTFSSSNKAALCGCQSISSSRKVKQGFDSFNYLAWRQWAFPG